MSPTIKHSLVVLGAFVIFGIIAAGYLMLDRRAGQPVPEPGEQAAPPREAPTHTSSDPDKAEIGTRTYSNRTVGIEFQYSAGYFLEEKNIDDGGRDHFTLILTANTEENRLVREGKAPGREGPVAITLDVYDNPKKLSSLDWVKTSPDSNFQLSNKNYMTTAVGGRTAIAYNWDGLYRADSFAIASEDQVYFFTVTYLDLNDEIRMDLARLLGTVVFK